MKLHDLFSATAPHHGLNADGQRHADRCVELARDRVPLRYPDGSETGFGLTRELQLLDGSCPPGRVRLDHHEWIESPAGPLAFHRGGRGYADAQNVKYGHVALDDMAADPGRPTRSGGHRGSPVPPAEDVRIAVRSIPPQMHYKRPQDVRSGSNRGARFLHYGDPAADQGDRHDVHYTYLLWSCLNARGGGMVRALLRDGQIVTRCEVEPVRMASWDGAGERNGFVEMLYVRTAQGLYGWSVGAHALHEGPPIEHVLPFSRIDRAA